MFDFKGLINALLRKKSDDPVGDLKSATIWVQELPQADIHRALQEILKALSKLQQNTTTSLPERLQVLFYLDEKARSLQNTLCRAYLHSAGETGKETRHKLATITHFWDAMAEAYYEVIRAYSKNPVRKLNKQLPLVTAKAMHFLAMQGKWRYMRYLPIETYTWRRMGRLYLFAEREGFKDKAVHLYPDQPDTTCAREYIRVMMLHLANPGSLQPEKIELVDQWLDNWSSSVEIEPGYRPHRQNYAINLGDAKPPRKLRRNMVDEKYRYWSVSLLSLNINQVIAQLQEGVFPARLKLGEDCRMPACMDFIDEISKRWTGESSTRKHERVSAEKPQIVVEGLQNIISHIQKDRQSRTPPLSQGGNVYAEVYLQPKNSVTRKEQAALPSSGEPELFEPSTLKLTLHNESLGGMGASFISSGEDKLRLGSLIALKKPDSKQLSIGVVRHLSKEAPEQVRIGIQVWTPTPVVVNIFPVQKEKGPAKSVKAIYLPEYPELHLGRSIVMSSEIYAPGKQLTIMAQGKSYVIALQQAVAHSREYTRAGFDLVRRSRVPT